MMVESSHRGPDFIIVGAQKCGTSALKRNLEMHDAISMAEGEIHFFNRPAKWSKGFDWYTGHFTRTDKVQGEKTPDYLDDPSAAQRIAGAFPEVKLIILLRDPVTRAYSHWNHMMQRIESTAKRGWEDVSFEEGIARASRGVTPFTRLLDKGHYVEQVRRYADNFPREQIFIGIQERFLSNGAEELARVFRFLGVEELPVKPEKRHVRTYDAPINPATRQQLLQYFAPFNARLFEFLGEDVPEWGRP
jgi:hypothetical protein